MGTWELLVIAIGLSMDAFAVSICKGLSIKKASIQQAATTGAYFGGFQAIMPLLGYFLGSRFSNYIRSLDHWIAFILLALIGVNMIREAFSNDEEKLNDSFGFKAMLPLAIATSIDALAVGVGFAFLDVSIFHAVAFIGIITFAFSCIGIYIGNAFGSRFKSKADLAGGCILILMGIKILIEHLAEG